MGGQFFQSSSPAHPAIAGEAEGSLYYQKDSSAPSVRNDIPYVASFPTTYNTCHWQSDITFWSAPISPKQQSSGFPLLFGNTNSCKKATLVYRLNIDPQVPGVTNRHFPIIAERILQLSVPETVASGKEYAPV
ncbi:hypothetical protein A8C56_05365 [Niabella ginsenosidivorans]|uniref:Uncharacterized protein n=1 Tax=Niabella ginsenosidivorans TaxID=1176587 RepID=A0A1A9I1Q4_9BACT|nr:hypothetical protein [Niabella ginsenosidivorans]ANH80494.1 hypothetical protein A8C56_05365 [Niabella ginsenosidivorans]